MTFDEQTLFDNAIEAWMRHHRMTYSLLDKLTEAQLRMPLPHPELNTFAKHYEEMAAVQQAYALAFVSGKLDFSMLPRDNEYTGTKSQKELRADMEAADKAVLDGSAACPPDRVIDIFGNKCSRIDLVHTLLHHELFHHGMFNNYAWLKEFNLPQDWRDFWWIPAPFPE